MDLSCAQRNLQSRSATSRCACNSSAAPPVVSVRSASSVTGQPAPTAARCLHAPLRPRRCRRKGVVCAQADDLEVPQDNKSVLIKYVNEVDPSVVDSFEHSGPPQVVDAMQAAVIGLCGHLPPQFFEINVVTLGENLRMLMHSFMSTGYLYRHIADHLEMQAGIDRALPSGVLQDDAEQDLAPGRSFGWRSQNWDGYAKGSNTSDVSGEVVRWSHDNGVAKLDASQYIEMLEREVEILRQELDDSNEALDVEESGMGGNEVLQYMRTHGQSQAAQIRPGPEVREAMDVFLQRLLGTDSSKELASMVSETSLKELSRLLLWVMIVGYTLRSMEVRFSMGRAYALPYVALEDKGSRDNFDKL